MTINTKLDEKPEGADNLRAWNIESCSLLKKNNLEEFIEENIPKLEEDEDNQKGHLASVYHSDSTPSS